MKRTIVVCFDDGKWLQDTIEVPDIHDSFRFTKAKDAYRSEYEKAKESIPIMKVAAPSIVHIAFVD